MLSNFEFYRLKNAGMTNLGINKLLAHYKIAPEKISLRKMGIVAGVKSIADFLERYKSQDVKCLRDDFKRFPSFSINESIYPERLKQIYNPPFLLFYQGNLELLKRQKVAFVGSRACSENGQAAVQKIIRELQNKLVIVSGLARGIDAASHVAAIKNAGQTIAVIGTGLQVAYPKENRPIQEYMCQKHLVLSEYGPDEKPLKYHFPDRNRIIAGLARGVVVIEAKMRSGSLITCERAMEEGRDVYAVPGQIKDSYSEGCHYLIQQGAKLVFRGHDILEEYFD
ncbi:DNA-processing protein DprA [Lactococcus sp.]|uniref:DNA-processing protein DprA n=1 Tax=Lactococcus sp. TaxID=44273 RepID=UPI0035AFCFFB